MFPLPWLRERFPTFRYSASAVIADGTIQVRIGYVSETDVLVEGLNKLGEYVNKNLSS